MRSCSGVGRRSGGGLVKRRWVTPTGCRARAYLWHGPGRHWRTPGRTTFDPLPGGVCGGREARRGGYGRFCSCCPVGLGAAGAPLCSGGVLPCMGVGHKRKSSPVPLGAEGVTGAGVSGWRGRSGRAAVPMWVRRVLRVCRGRSATGPQPPWRSGRRCRAGWIPRRKGDRGHRSHAPEGAARPGPRSLYGVPGAGSPGAPCCRRTGGRPRRRGHTRRGLPDLPRRALTTCLALSWRFRRCRCRCCRR